MLWRVFSILHWQIVLVRHRLDVPKHAQLLIVQFDPKLCVVVFAFGLEQQAMSDNGKVTSPSIGP